MNTSLETVTLDRCDRGEVLGVEALDGPLARRDGTKVYNGILARTGVLVYRTATGQARRELVTLDTLRSMIPTTRFSAVTNEHPKSSTGIALDVTRDTAKDLAAGHVGGEADVELVETEDGEGYIKVRFVVDDPETIDLVDNKELSELSPKYRTEYLAAPGEHPLHGKYDGVQQSRDVNAVALTRKGRGSAVFVRADSAYQESLMDAEDKVSHDNADQEATPALSDELVSKLAERLMERLSALMADKEAPAAEEAPAADEAMEEAAITEDAADEHVEGHEKDAADEHVEGHEKDAAEEEMITVPKAKYDEMMAALKADGYKEKADSAFLEAFQRRSRILEAAKGQGVTLSDSDMSRPNDSLLASVAKNLLPQNMHSRADSDPGFCEGVLFASETHDSRHDGLGGSPSAPTRSVQDIDPWEAGLRARQESQ